MFPPPSKIKIGLKKAGNPTRQEPAALRAQLKRIGLSCNDITDQYLQRHIDEVRSTLPSPPTDKPNESYLISELKNSVRFSAGEVAAESRSLVSTLTKADLPTQLFFHCLTSTEPGRRDCVDELLCEDEPGRDFTEKVRRSHASVVDFVRQSINGSRSMGSCLTQIATLESPALSLIAQLAASGQEPKAVGVWVPDVGKVSFITEMFTIQQNWDKVKQKLGSSFMGQDLSWKGRDKVQYKDGPDFVKLMAALAFESTAPLLGGLDKVSTEAEISNNITSSQSIHPQNYDSGLKTLVLYLAKNYQEDVGAEAIASLTIDYQIKVRDYRDKDKHASDYKGSIEGRSRAIQYYTEKQIKDYLAAANE